MELSNIKFGNSENYIVYLQSLTPSVGFILRQEPGRFLQLNSSSCALSSGLCLGGLLTMFSGNYFGLKLVEIGHQEDHKKIVFFNILIIYDET